LTGLNGSKLHSSFPCLFVEESGHFIVWLGDVTIDKFTKSTFLTIAEFAENQGASQLVFVQLRDHTQKGSFKLYLLKKN